MNAIGINKSNLNIRTSEQAIQAFYALYNQDAVRVQLTEVFCRYTAMSTNGKIQYDENIAAFVQLFDHLIALVGAIETLQQKPPKHRCIICNRTGNPYH